MFRTRYTHNNSQRSYIRTRYSAFNTPSTLNFINSNLSENDHRIDIPINTPLNMDIYNEDEEMTPAIGTESEEATEVNIDDNEDYIDDYEIDEDDIELESEYERMMTEFNESDEDKDDREETTEEEDSEEEIIIDQPLNINQMPHSFGEFAPYFNNITELLFFCWMQKYRICKLDSFKIL